MNRISLFASIVALTCVAACGSGQSQKREFPFVVTPSVYVQEQDIIEYQVNHFWDNFLKSEQCFPCDSVTVNGVSDVSLSKAALIYSQYLLSCDLALARKSLLELLEEVESFQLAYPESNMFSKVTELMSGIEYDPNSPYRDEDIYGPFAEALAASQFCPADRVASYRNESRLCALNSRGTKASDFEYIDMGGRPRSLYGTKAEWMVLNFINPGCHACEEVVSAFESPEFKTLISNGSLCILGMYIDEEIDKWFEQRQSLPENWICGYDPCSIIRNDIVYNVRAIPSVYLLDKDKNVILKDAPLDRVLRYIQNFVL